MTKKQLKIGQWVGFKSDYEQYGEIVSIKGNWLVLKNENGFGDEYLRYAKTASVHVDQVWVD